MGITYSNCVTKIYTLASFFPSPQDEITKNDHVKAPIEFKIMKDTDPIREKRKEKRKTDAKQAKVYQLFIYFIYGQ